MNKALIILSFLFILTKSMLSQDTIRKYYDKNWEKVSNKNAAVFYGKSFKGNNKIWITHDYYANNQLQMKGSFKSKKLKVKIGHFTYYYENGKLKSEGDYLKGENEGKWEYFYDNGQLQSEGSYSNGKKEGLWNYYYENGTSSSKGNYLNGLEEGNWQYFYENGQLKYEGSSINGKSKGVWKYWYENGKKQAKGNYINNYKDGLWNYYYESGMLKDEETFENGILSFSIGYFENGSKKYKGAYVNGLAQGEFVYWNVEGRVILKGQFNLGERNGEWIRSFKEGEMKIYYDRGNLLGKELGGLVKSE